MITNKLLQQLVIVDKGEESFGTLPPISPTMLLQVCMSAIYSSSEETFEA